MIEPASPRYFGERNIARIRVGEAEGTMERMRESDSSSAVSAAREGCGTEGEGQSNNFGWGGRRSVASSGLLS